MSRSLVFDSVTHVTAAAHGRAALCASHGGRYAGYYAAKMGLGAVILNDAGIGRDRAGLAALMLLEELSVPAATVSHLSARIGEGQHSLAHGKLSAVNGPAARLGLRVGMSAFDAMAIFDLAPLTPARAPKAEVETRVRLTEACHGDIMVHAVDSVTLVEPSDASHIVVTASHGGCPGGNPANAIKQPVFAAVYCDAGFGCDNAGITRLPALDARGIAAASVSTFSCRIGEGLSVWRDGVVSIVNRTAAELGAQVGEPTSAFVARMVAVRSRRS